MHADDALKQMLSLTPQCLAVDRLSETLTNSERQHVERCSRCQTELQLWREFDLAEPSADEGAAIQWIVAELARRNSPATEASSARRFGWLTPSVRRWAGAAASVAMLATFGYLAWDREPPVRERTNANETYRTESLQVVRPVGDLASAPEALEWVVVPGAVGYDVEVLEVDHTVLWRATSWAARIDLPPTLVRKLVPGKTILWQVRAHNAADRVIAQSGLERVRIELSK